MKTQMIFIKLLMVSVCLVLFSASIPGHAASLITVNSLVDENDGSCSDADCSLRDALQVALPGDTLNFSVTGTITLTLGELVINKTLTIQGPGKDALSISGNKTSRVFRTLAGIPVHINDLTIQDGAADDGAGIANAASLYLERVILIGNIASGDGGGIDNHAILSIHESSLVGNVASYGGGLKNETGTAFIYNSTFFGNTARTRGGGMDNGSNSTVIIKNSTFWGNIGNGIANPSSSTTIYNSYIARSVDSSDCDGSFEPSSSHNLASDASCPSPAFTQIAWESLGVFRVGWVLPLHAGSVAIDAGDEAQCTEIDQLGTPRPQDGNRDGIAVCDIGSYERPGIISFLPLVVR